MLIGPLHNPVARSGAVALHPTEAVQLLDYDDAASWRAAKGKVALLGVVGGTEDVMRTVDGTRYGVEVLASMVQTLVRQAAPSRVEVEVDVLAALGVGVGTAALGRALRPRLRLLSLLVPLFALAVAAALALGGTLMAASTLALAGALGAYVAHHHARVQ